MKNERKQGLDGIETIPFGIKAIINLATLAEQPGVLPMPAKSVEAYNLSVEIPIEATPAKVWTTLTKDIGKWWPKHFFSGEEAKTFVVEGKLGGRAYEDWGDGAGAVWGTIIVWNPGQKMTWACEMYPGFGGPGRSFVSFELASQGKSTVVRMTDAGICPDAKTASSLQSGWTELLGFLKAHCEAKK